MSSVRLRRLGADFAKLQEYVRRHPRVRLIQSDGDPPERYQLEYRIKSLRMANGELVPVMTHLVEITLPRNYPRTPPQCRMLSPVFHPNIAPHAICVGDHWSAGESLQSIITRIGEMLAYQSYNVKSPLNGEAARWVEENKHRVPLDQVSLLVDEQSHETTSTPKDSRPKPAPSSSSTNISKAQVAAPPKPAPQSANQITCPSCGKSYQVSTNLAGRKVRCQSCLHVFQFPVPDPPTSPSNGEAS